MGAEMAIERHQRAGRHQGARRRKLKLVAARLPATPPRRPRTPRSAWWRRRPTWSAATGSYLSSFTLAVTEVTERAEAADADAVLFGPDHLARLQVRVPDLGDGGSQAEQSLPVIAQARRDRHGHASRRRSPSSWTTPRASVASAKPMSERLLEGARPRARRRRDLHAAARRTRRRWCRRCAARGRTCFLAYRRSSGRQAAHREDERVRPGPGQDADRSRSASPLPSRTCCRPCRRSCCRA